MCIFFLKSHSAQRIFFGNKIQCRGSDTISILQIERERDMYRDWRPNERGNNHNSRIHDLISTSTCIYMRFFFYIESFSLGAKLLSFYAWLLIAIRIETGGPTGNWRLKEFRDTTQITYRYVQIYIEIYIYICGCFLIYSSYRSPKSRSQLLSNFQNFKQAN